MTESSPDSPAAGDGQSASDGPAAPLDLATAGWSIPPEIYADAAVVLDHALQGDRDGVTTAFDAVVDRGGVRGAYDLASCLAAAIVGDRQPAGPAALDFPDIEQARYDARWVARFVSAYANADDPTGQALFGAAMADGYLSECLMTLAGSTVATLRRRGVR